MPAITTTTSGAASAFAGTFSGNAEDLLTAALKQPGPMSVDQLLAAQFAAMQSSAITRGFNPSFPGVEGSVTLTPSMPAADAVTELKTRRLDEVNASIERMQNDPGHNDRSLEKLLHIQELLTSSVASAGVPATDPWSQARNDMLQHISASGPQTVSLSVQSSSPDGMAFATAVLTGADRTTLPGLDKLR